VSDNVKLDQVIRKAIAASAREPEITAASIATRALALVGLPVSDEAAFERFKARAGEVLAQMYGGAANAETHAAALEAYGDLRRIEGKP